MTINGNKTTEYYLNEQLVSGLDKISFPFKDHLINDLGNPDTYSFNKNNINCMTKIDIPD